MNTGNQKLIRELWITPEVKSLLDSRANPTTVSLIYQDIEMMLSPDMDDVNIIYGSHGTGCLIKILPTVPGTYVQRVVMWHAPTDWMGFNSKIEAKLRPYEIGFA